MFFSFLCLIKHTSTQTVQAGTECTSRDNRYDPASFEIITAFDVPSNDAFRVMLATSLLPAF
jgi:hypothetical protein